MPALSPLVRDVSFSVALVLLAAHRSAAQVTAPGSQPARPTSRPDPKGRSGSWTQAWPQSRPASRPAEPHDPKVVVTATRTERAAFDAPQPVDVITSRDVEARRQSRTTPEALKESPGVLVQKTAHGQGSPKIRGLTGFQTLFLLNGIRLNNSAWRSGNVEYWNTVDAYAFDRIEVARGPSSVVWGTDAVSGTGFAHISERTSFDPGVHGEARLMFRYASAENSYIERVETEGNIDDFGWSGGVSIKDFGQIIGGADTGRMPNTGYQELDADVELTLRTGSKSHLTVGFLHVHQEDAPRTHSTTASKSYRGTTVGTDFRRDFTHERDLVFAQFRSDAPTALWDRITLSSSIMYHEEIERRVPSNSRHIEQGVVVVTFGEWIQAEKATTIGRLTYGVDWYHDEVDSFYREYNPNGSLRTVRERGPVADNAYYDQLGAYLQDEIPLDRRVDLILGGRFNYFVADADEVDVPGDSVTFDQLHEDFTSVVGSARVVARPTDATRLFAGIAQSFRAPNLCDYTRFDVARSGEQEVPAENLDPERYLTVETGARFDDGRKRAAVSWFYTWVDDQILRVPTGNTVGGLREVSKDNVGDGFITGIEAEGAICLDWIYDELSGWELYGYFDWIDGRIEQVETPGTTVERHLNALPPASGLVGVRWDAADQRTGIETFVRMAHSQHRLTPEDRLDTQRIPPNGVPGYAVLGARGWHRLNERARVSLAIENIGNIDYRLMGSGLNEPGTNVIASVEIRL